MDTLPVLYFSLVFLLFGLCLGSIGFYGYAVYAAIDYWTHANPEVDAEFHPRLTVLKPLCGVHADAEAALQSFCQQDYPDYQILFAAQNATDPSVEIVQKLMQKFPDRDINLVINQRSIGLNSTVNLLANASTAAKYGLWVIAERDIAVGPDYLQQIVQPFRYPGIGLVTCPYRSQPQEWLSRLQAVGASTEFHPAMLVARRMQGVQFAIASTIVIRKDVLLEAGGFEAIANTPAADYQLGYLVAKAGFRVMLSHYVVDRLVPASCWSTWQHQINWTRSLWNSQPWGYWGKMITYGTVASSLLLWLLQGLALGWLIFAATWITRLAMGYWIGQACRNDQMMRRNWALLPLYDFLSLGIWSIDLVRQLFMRQEQPFRFQPNSALQDIDPQFQPYDRSCRLEEPALEEI